MPTVTSVIDSIATPPIGSLNPVLDTAGPYSAGDHNLTTFTTGGAFLLPAGTYQVHGTYGVIVVATTIPATWGQSIGYDSGAALGNEGNVYENRLCQLAPQHELVSGFWATLDLIDVHTFPFMTLWPFRLIGGDRLGLHVEPSIAVDLYYLTVL